MQLGRVEGYSAGLREPSHLMWSGHLKSTNERKENSETDNGQRLTVG